MDTLTHALVGAAISDGWFRRRLGAAATPMALAAAALPDLDIPFALLLTPEDIWSGHRSYSHSFFTLAPAALILGLILARLAGGRDGRRDRAGWTLLILSCLYSHVVLDICTSWGTLAFLPFSSRVVSLDAAPIVDIFIFSLSLASFVVNRLCRRERTETFANPLAYPVVHGRPERARFAGRLARPAVILMAVYLAVGWLQNRQVRELAERELAETGARPLETRALPLPFTHLAWGIAARDAEGRIHNALFSSLAPAPLRFGEYASVPSPEVDLVLASPIGLAFTRQAQGLFTAEAREIETAGEPAARAAGGPEAEPPPPGARLRVELRDRRFFSLAPPWRANFGKDVFLDRDSVILETRDVRPRFGAGDYAGELSRLWRLITTGGTETPGP